MIKHATRLSRRRPVILFHGLNSRTVTGHSLQRTHILTRDSAIVRSGLCGAILAVPQALTAIVVLVNLVISEHRQSSFPGVFYRFCRAMLCIKISAQRGLCRRTVSVCLFVRIPSLLCILSKRINISSLWQYSDGDVTH